MRLESQPTAPSRAPGRTEGRTRGVTVSEAAASPWLRPRAQRQTELLGMMSEGLGAAPRGLGHWPWWVLWKEGAGSLLAATGTAEPSPAPAQGSGRVPSLSGHLVRGAPAAHPRKLLLLLQRCWIHLHWTGWRRKQSRMSQLSKELQEFQLKPQQPPPLERCSLTASKRELPTPMEKSSTPSSHQTLQLFPS